MTIRQKRASVFTAAVAALAAAGAVAAGTGLPQGSETVRLDPADFSTRIDNPWWPMKPGTTWVYRETNPDGARQKVVIRVTNQTKRIANGVLARVVRDTVTENGVLVEDTWDWYAQDRAGNIWYLGELTKEYENGKYVGTAGSFEAGVDGAQAGIAIPAHPTPGLRYRQEYYRGHAEDRASIVSVRERAEVPAGVYRDVVMTRDINPLQPRVLELKFYARGVGPVLVLGVSGGADREELVNVRRGR